MDWINLVPDREKRKVLVNTVMNLRVPKNVEKFFSSRITSGLSRMVQLFGVSIQHYRHYGLNTDTVVNTAPAKFKLQYITALDRSQLAGAITVLLVFHLLTLIIVSKTTTVSQRTTDKQRTN
jgi:hypothetical protein